MKMRMIAVAALCALSLGSLAIAAEAPAEGTQIEVREGNVWSRATFLRKEGRKIQVRYDDGTEDWIMADRMRPLGTSAKAGSTPASAGPSAPSVPSVPSVPSAPAESAVSLDGPFIEIRMDNAVSPRLALGSPLRLKPTTRPAPTAAPFVKLTPSAAVPIQPIRDFIICPDAPQVIIGTTEVSRGEEGQVLLIDLMKPEEFEVRTIQASDHEILGAANGGKLLLSTPRGGNAVTIHLWEYDGQIYRPKANYTLVSEKGGKKVQWASLQSESRAVVGCDGGECYLVDLRTRRALSFFKSHRTNDHSLLGGGAAISAQENQNIGLVRANDFAVIAKLADADAVSAVDPTGLYAAYAMHGRGIRVIKTATGASTGTIAGALGNGQEDVDLISNEALLVGHRMLYSVKTGMPVWEYDFQDLRKSVLVSSGQMLLAFADGATTSLCLATLPDPAAVATIKSAKPSDFLLAPGAEIGVSGDLARIYGAEAQEAAENVKKAMASAGHKLVPGDNSLMLVFKAAPGKTGEFVYRERPTIGRPMMGPPPARKVPSPSTDVTVTLMSDDQPIWQQSFHFQAGFMVLAQGGMTIEQAIANEARPKAGTLNGLAIPSYIAPGSTLTKPAALRQSVVTPEGFGPATTPTPTQAAPKQKGPTGAANET